MLYSLLSILLALIVSLILLVTAAAFTPFGLRSIGLDVPNPEKHSPQRYSSLASHGSLDSHGLLHRA